MSNGHKSLTSTSELNISVTGTVFSAKALKEKKKEIELLIKGYNLGVDYIQNHPTDSLKEILIEEIGIPEALAGIIALPQYTHASLPSMDDLEKCVSWLIEKNIIHKSFQYANVIDSSYIQSEQVNIEK
jgi:NitT/TauT family transport system substrate-binding protein